jgi:hypothetical protein
MGWKERVIMIFDGHLHLPSSPIEEVIPSQLMGGLAISKSVEENELYVRAAQRLGLKCAVFVGGSEGDLERVMRWVEDGEACAYDHVELCDRFDARKMYPMLKASSRTGRPFVAHFSHHNENRTPDSLVSSCLDYLTENFPGLRVVVAHLGSENYETVLAFADANPNLFLDISRLKETAERGGWFSPIDLLKDLADSVPASQIIFGTDQVGPWDPASSQSTWRFVRYFRKRTPRRYLPIMPWPSLASSRRSQRKRPRCSRNVAFI